MARKASPSTCSKGAGLGAQADARVPKVTLYPGVAPHWTGNLESRQMCWRCVPPELEMGVWRGELESMGTLPASESCKHSSNSIHSPTKKDFRSLDKMCEVPLVFGRTGRTRSMVGGVLSTRSVGARNAMTE